MKILAIDLGKTDYDRAPHALIRDTVRSNRSMSRHAEAESGILDWEEIGKRIARANALSIQCNGGGA